MRTAGNHPEGSLSPLPRREKVRVRVLSGSARALLVLWPGLLLVLALACGDSQVADAHSHRRADSSAYEYARTHPCPHT